MPSVLKSSINTLHGIGAVKARSYAKIGINNIEDLLYHYPRAYENRGNVKLLSECPHGTKSAVLLTVATLPKTAKIRKGMSLLKFRAYDESGMCEITYFNQDYLKTAFPLGATFRFYGKIEISRTGKYSMSSPSYELYTEDAKLRDFSAVYPSTEGISQKQIAQNIALTLKLAENEIIDHLPIEILKKRNLCDLKKALSEIHNPSSYTGIALAKKRLVYDEFFTFALGLNLSAKVVKEKGAPVFTSTDINELTNIIPYTLTNAQKHAIEDISRDVSCDEPMSRIIIGDVGCGKTICAAAAIFMAVKSGYQAALMTPTEILSRQHFADLSELFSKLNIKCELLVGALTPAKKKKIVASLESGDIDVIIGTQALLSDGVEFNKLGLVVVDEQHRFGVEQRSILSKRSKKPHLLVMSATPIPRSMALAMYGNLDKTIIDEIPPGRQRVDTFLVDESYRQRLDGFIKKQIDEGGQVYIVCPAVEEAEIDEGEVDLFDISEVRFIDERPPLKAAIEYSAEISQKFPEYKTAFIHGKLKSVEKERIMADFASGETKILVSTTVIEVGVNVPNACLMIVENAERFGLSQLHQLRGRVGRGQRKSYCILVSDSTGVNAKKRLNTMCKMYDGYKIAEADLELRGPGDFLKNSSSSSLRQSGGIRFKIADMCEDADIMKNAINDANELIKEHGDLHELPLLRARVEAAFSADHGEIS